jgi:FlaA1/EpsC-like NDP-sugar epimerase
VDGVVLVLAFALAYLLRFDFQIPERNLAAALQQLPLVLAVQWVTLVMVGAYTFVWRYVGMTEIATFVKAGIISTGILLVLRLTVPGDLVALRVPLSIILMYGLLAGGGVLGVRVLRRALSEYGEQRTRRSRAGAGRVPRVLLVGAGAAGVMAVRELHSRGDVHLDVRGFVDDDPVKRGAMIQGVKVVGATGDLPRLVRDVGIDHVVITIADLRPGQMRRILDICESIPVRARMIPGLHEVLRGQVEISRFRDVQPEELLERAAVRLDEGDLERLLGDQVVMVTGAGGSIGSELARQVARVGPSSLLLVERAEPVLFEVDRELRDRWPDLEIVPILADIGDPRRMRAVLAERRPQVVAHAAAHKHVPLMEANPVEAVRNNILGTLTLGELAGEHGAGTFILISTDKAVRPSSVMGASKRVAELVLQDLGGRFSTKYVAVRFGNVLDSSGSVIPILREQIARGGPVTITHPEMKRYFMTIPEAAVLVLHAGALSEGGEIFVLDMGEPVRILDLAKKMIELSGHGDEGEIDIVFTGIRPGEKLFEELETSDEAITKTRHPKIFIGKIAGRPSEELAGLIERLRAVCAAGEGGAELREMLADFLPDSQMRGGPAGERADAQSEDPSRGISGRARSG